VSIHKTLREARTRIGMSQDHAAEHLGISGASFSRMEAGLSAVTTTRLVKLAALYRVSATALLEGAVVTEPTAIDLKRLKLVVIEIERVIAALNVRPSPEKIAEAIATLYSTEIDFIIRHPRETFDPSRHAPLLQLIFRN
jgi:transcriptional regulator with XRE-family HTH domain